MQALVDITSTGKGKVIYAKKGETLTIVNTEHGDVLIVKAKKGEPFPAHKSKLIEQ
ncbi:MAG: hypothetical protein JWQ09_5608 [Segetibacter sp.]|nr:hypothetical protein [Segetibacter sp.]